MTTPIEAIAALDRVLSTLKESWEDADQKSKAKWMDRINTALDERMVLMKQRDETPWTPGQA